MTQRDTILILGASGRFGRNCADAFTSAGWDVRRFDRKNDDLLTAAKGVDVILNGWNPAYPDWAKTVPQLTKQVIAAAKASGATVIMPGNVYNFGKDAPQNFNESTPHRAQNTLGKIRAEMEAAYQRSGVPTIILRGGDFLDTTASGNWFDMIMIKKLAKGMFEYPGNTEIPHAWAYLPDLARACVQLAEKRGELDRFEDIPFPGYTMTGVELHREVQIAAARTIRLKNMSWLPLRLISPFIPMVKHLVEMSYLWNKPHHLDGRKFNRLLPDFEMTPVAAAVASAVSLDINPDKAVVRGKIAA